MNDTDPDTEAAYRAILHRPSHAPGIVKVGFICAVVAWGLALTADVAKVHFCAAEGGTWGARGTCEPPNVEIKQYHVVIPPSGEAPRVAPSQPEGPKSPLL